jgi:hypothetical protein
MPAYFRSSIAEFLATSDDSIVTKLHTAYASDGYQSQYTTQTIAWALTLPALRRELSDLLQRASSTATWHILLEYPLYRLRRRIDAVVLTPDAVVVLELKTGAKSFEAADRRQAEEYAQDLRDFHAGSTGARLRPILWALEVEPPPLQAAEPDDQPGVSRLLLVGQTGLATALMVCAGPSAFNSVSQAAEYAKQWDEAPYHPVPSVIEAAVTLFAGHGVREIALANAKNLGEAASAVYSIIERSRLNREYAVVFLTGVPGAGKTLAGLNVVHTAIREGVESEGDIVYLSGNTPLVVVLREALARDRYGRVDTEGRAITMADARASTRATVQHINDFLKQYVHGSIAPPSEHVIVFDEAQRAWNARQGKEKFGRDASEPLLVLETMVRHSDWAVCVCLIGRGQEINDGEEGVGGWADALARLSVENADRWKVYGPDLVFGASRSTETLGELPEGVETVRTESLHLDVPMRSFRSPKLGAWIEHLIGGELAKAAATAERLSYPLRITRSLDEAKAWLRQSTLGERRMGLLASSGAKRLRADGLGQMLSATDGQAIAHWYLNPPGDIRSSFALEVPANEYTSQGLEIDFACLCWGGDLIHKSGRWVTRALSGNRWTVLSDDAKRLFVLNSYRVLLSRAREGLVIWVPRGDGQDHTRSPDELDGVADCLSRAGVRPLD